MLNRSRCSATAHPDGDGPQKSADVRAGGELPGHGTKSEAVREQAIVALLSAKSVGAAARQCGLNEKTLRRWLSDDEAFKSELAEARRGVFEAAINRVQALTTVAIDTLAALMGRGVPPAVRLGAVRTVAELAMHQHDADTILRKLHEIEAAQARRR